MKSFRRWVLMIGMVSIAACGGGGGTVGPSEPLLPGDPAALAIDTLPMAGPTFAPAADRSGDLLLTRISVTLDDGATVADLNAAAEAVGATGIAYAEPGSPFLTLIVPRQRNGAVLFDLAERLMSSAGILFAAPGRQLAAMTLPGQAAGSPQATDQLSHLLPARFPAAWNAAFTETGERLPAAQNCTPAEATVIVVDLFESVPPNAGTQLAPFNGAQRIGAFQSGPNGHGWQVAATLASAFDELLPTGATPLTECLDIVLVDVSGLSYVESVATFRRAIAAQPAFARIIVNLSVGFGSKFCGPNWDAVCTVANLDVTPRLLLQGEIFYRIASAIHWASVTSAALDERLLLAQAAGNEAATGPENGGLGLLYPGIRDSSLASPIALATQLQSLTLLFSPGSVSAQSLWTSQGHPSLLLNQSTFDLLQDRLASGVTRAPDTSNLLRVGSVTNRELPAEVTESAFSNEGPSVRAVGEEVVGLGGVLLDGTSVATPQVAGLAAYLWSISGLEDRPAQETANIIKAIAAQRGNLRLLDAYATTLALDALLTLPTTGIREALLDVNGDERFDEADLLRFEAAYGLDDPNTPTIPAGRDYGRFDLNGDGATGGVITEVFDLDRNAIGPGGAPVINAVDREIEGYPLTFNEEALSDLQILCFYAYSTVFADTNPSEAQIQARTSILGPDHCVGARMEALLPAEISGSSNLDVTVEVPSGDGQFAPAGNLLVTFTSTCASVSPTSGRTDASGNISTTVTPGTGCSSVSITAVASADIGTTTLAQKTVSATVPGALNFDMTGRWKMSITGFADSAVHCVTNLANSFGIATITQTPQSGFSGSWDYQGGFCGANIGAASGTLAGQVALNASTGQAELRNWRIQVTSVSNTQVCVAFMPEIEVRSPTQINFFGNSFGTTDAFGAVSLDGCPAELQFSISMGRCGTTNVVCP